MNDLCSRPRQAGPDTILTRTGEGRSEAQVAELDAPAGSHLFVCVCVRERGREGGREGVCVRERGRGGQAPGSSGP